MCEKSRNTKINAVQDWHRWCRLCAKADVQNINIFTNKITGNRLAKAIKKYFEVEVRADWHLPLQLCTKCFFLLESLRTFNKRVMKVQEMYNALHEFPDNTEETDIDAMRLIYGVFEDDQPHDFMHPLAETKLIGELCIYENEETCATIGTDTWTELVKPHSHIERKKEEVRNEFPPFTYANEFDFENNDVNSDEDPIGNGFEPLNGTETKSGNDKGDCGKTSANDEQTSEEKTSETTQLKKTPARDTECIDDSEQEKPITCPECSKGFHIFSRYRRHMKAIHAKDDIEPQFVCPECPLLSFNTQIQLNHHRTYKHLPREERRTFPCPYCEQKLLSKGAMRQHVRFVHMNERSFVCEECGKAVQTKNLLEQHMLTHTDYAPFECEVCKRCFKNHLRLKKHMQSHNPNKYACKECGKKLTTVANLLSHMVVHSDKTPHKCDYCGRAFKRPKALRNHLIIHAGLKPYSCDFCDRTYANISNYRAHQKQTHPEEFAAMKTSGEEISPKKLPTLAVLKALAKTAENLVPVIAKRKQPKLPISTIDAPASTSSTSSETNI